MSNGSVSTGICLLYMLIQPYNPFEFHLILKQFNFRVGSTLYIVINAATYIIVDSDLSKMLYFSFTCQFFQCEEIKMAKNCHSITLIIQKMNKILYHLFIRNV